MNIPLSVEVPLPITTPEQLEYALGRLGSFYFSADSKRFFGSKVLKVWPVPDGCVWLERLSANPGGTAYKACRLELHSSGYEIHSLFSNWNVVGPKAKRLATKAAEEYADAHPC